MSEPERADGRGTVDHVLHVEELCDRYEDELRAGRRPTVEDFLRAAGFSPTGTPADLVRELVRLEAEYYGRAGETAPPDGCDRRSPQPADETRTHPARSGEDTATGSPGGAPPPGGPSIPGYEILEKLGEGAMGVVYKARQLNAAREVALKVIRAGHHASATERDRFRTEAAAVARLQHPHVVQVFEVGQCGGLPFFSLELCPGGNLSQKLAGNPMPPRDAAGLVEKLAQGVRAAHEAGVVHRDLKPANVLLTADGTPKVTDFGLAKLTDAGEAVTVTGAVMGTPSYMAPEQAAGRSKFVGPPADVWALGVILYECVAGRRPFEAGTAEALLSQIQSAEPTALRSRARSVPRDLDTIVSKCLAKEPDLRYPTATELADDLARFLRGEPIRARPVSQAERLVRWVRRKPTAAAAWGFSALAAVLALVVFVVFGFWRAAEGSRESAEGAKSDADTARKRVEDLLGTESRLRGELQITNGKLEIALKGEQEALKQVGREREKLARVNNGYTTLTAHQAWNENNFAEARALLSGTRPDLRNWEYDYLHRLMHPESVKLIGHERQHSVWSPDGSRVLTICTGPTARIWNAATGQVLTEIKVGSKWLADCSWSPDGSKVVYGRDDKSACVWDAGTGKLLVELNWREDKAYCASWSPDGSRILTTGGRMTRIWDAATGEQLHEFAEYVTIHAWPAWSPDGSKLAFTSPNKTFRIRDAARGTIIKELKPLSSMISMEWDRDAPKTTQKSKGALGGPSSSIVSMEWNRDGSQLLTASEGWIRIWDIATDEAQVEFRVPSQEKPSPGTFGIRASWSRDGSKLVTFGEGGIARIWNAATGNLLAELKGEIDKPLAWHKGGRMVHLASWSPDGSMVLTVADGEPVRIWDATSGKVLREFKDVGPASRPWNPDGSRLLFGACVYDLSIPANLLELTGHSGTAWTGSWSPDGARVLTACEDGTARILDSTTGKTLADLKGHSNLVRTTSWSPDGSKVVTASLDKTARIWDAATGKPLAVLEDKGRVWFAWWSPDGARILTGGEVGTARVWDAGTGKLLTEFRVPGPPVLYGSWNPDGSRVLTVGRDAIARVWNSITGEEVTRVEGHRGEVGPGVEIGRVHINAHSWNRDGSKVVTCRHNTAQIWDPATGRILVVLEGHTDEVGYAVWSPDGSKVLTNDRSGTILLWDAETGKPVTQFIGRQSLYDTWLVWSPDGSRFVTDGRNGIRMWDVESGAEVLNLEGGGFASFSPDGTRLMTLAPGRNAVLIYDSRPANRASPRVAAAPRPRVKP